MKKSETAGPVTRDEAALLFAPLEDLDLIAVAVSGGGDSVALMRLLADWAAGAGRPAVCALTVNHGLRAEAAFEADQVAGWAKSAGLAHETLKGSGSAPTAGLQAYARELRFRLLTRWAEKHGADAVLLAHNQEDQAETLAMRLARGSGVSGLSAMAAETRVNGVRFVRPFLDIGRERLRETLKALGQDWLEDPGNRDSRFERVRVRAAIGQGGGAARIGLSAPALARSAGRLARADAALEHYCREFFTSGVTIDEAGYGIADAIALAGEPEEVRMRVLGELLSQIGAREVRHGARLEAALARLEAGAPAATLAGCRVASRGGKWMVTREVRGLARRELAPGRQTIWDRRFRIELVGCGQPVEIRSLGASGFARARSAAPALHDVPPVAGKALPGGFRGDDLVAPPAFVPQAEGAWLHIRFSEAVDDEDTAS